MTTRVFLFPGQGSQKRGMGAEVFPLFPELVSLADHELGYSLAELCLADSAGRLDHTRYTQPALFAVNSLMFLNRLLSDGRLPHFVAGHSLGEYSALFAAGVFDFQTGLRLVKKRAELMAEAKGGAMAAVIGLTRDQVQELLRSGGCESIDLANLNAPTQVVLSGPEAAILSAQSVMESGGAQLFKKLNVSGAFHSRYMAEAGRQFRAFLDQFEFATPRIPVVSNVTAKPYEAGQQKDLLARQLTEPVRWTESVQWLLGRPTPEFHEVGPGNVLAGLLRRIQSAGVERVTTPAIR
jgi:trans-AT polyketide synthase/acyltransferase/oxidoreductase domain-containing protein